MFNDSPINNSAINMAGGRNYELAAPLNYRQKDSVRICGDSVCDPVYFVLDSAKLFPVNVYPDLKFGPEVFLQDSAVIMDTICVN